MRLSHNYYQSCNFHFTWKIYSALFDLQRLYQQSEFLLFIYEIFCCFPFLDLHSPLLFCWGLSFKEGVCQVGAWLQRELRGRQLPLLGCPFVSRKCTQWLKGLELLHSPFSSRLCVDFIKDFPKYLSATFHLPQGSYIKRYNTSKPIV